MAAVAGDIPGQVSESASESTSESTSESASESASESISTQDDLSLVLERARAITFIICGEYLGMRLAPRVVSTGMCPSFRPGCTAWPVGGGPRDDTKGLVYLALSQGKQLCLARISILAGAPGCAAVPVVHS